LAAELRVFIDQVHAIPSSAVSPQPQRAGLAAFEDELSRVEAHAFPRLDPADVAHLLSLAQAFVAEPAPPETLLHSDLSAGNLLVDPEKRTLAGVIDFGLARGEPSYELAPLIDDFGLVFAAAVARADGWNSGRWSLPRARVLSLWDTLDWIGEQLEAGSTDGVDQAIAAIVRRLHAPEVS
jgi:aminoglycoside phosphotransferase (APT) family kinase protein